MTFDNILQRFAERYDGIMNTLIAAVPDFRSLEDAEVFITGLTTELGKHLLALVIEVMNEKLFRSDRRRTEGRLRVKQRGRQRTIYTVFGKVKVANDIYEDTTAPEGSERRFFSPVLEQLGLSPHQRMSDRVQKELLIGSLSMSYSKSAEHVGDGTLSRQTVHRVIRNAAPVGMAEIPDELIRVKELHVFMDEEHLSLQHDAKKSTIAPLAVLSEGFYREGKNGKGRSRLLNPRHFVAPDLKSATLVNEVCSFIEAVYDLAYMDRIVVHGDGASWIRKAFSDRLKVEYALDGFHLIRDINRFVHRFADTKQERKKLRRSIEKTMRNDDIAEFRRITAGLMAGTTDPAVLKKSQKFVEHIENCWSGAVARMSKKHPVPGSCTEAQVQHVMSCRTSSVPCSWSRKCVGTIGSWRAAQLNGMDLYSIDPEQHPANFYTAYIQEQTDEFIAGPHDWSIFEKENCSFDLDSGTQHLIQLIITGGANRITGCA